MTGSELTTLQDTQRFVVAAGTARWPGLVVDDEAITRQLARASSVALSSSPALAADWYIAVACSVNAPKAHDYFQAAYAEAIDSGARRIDTSQDFVSEVRQRVLELLFVGSPTSGPRIAQYKGQGPLAVWLRTTSKRVALRLGSANATPRLTSETALADELAEACDQELALLRAHYGSLFREALIATLRELPQRERVLLQLSFVAGMSTVRIAKMYHVNQSTISRQLQQVAHKTFDAAKTKLRAKLGVVSQELESILAIVRSHIEMTLSCLEEIPGTESSGDVT